MSGDNNQLAYEILKTLCESSLADELVYYRSDVQKELMLSDEQMNSLYNLNTLCQLLKPKIRTFKGRTIGTTSESTTSEVVEQKSNFEEQFRKKCNDNEIDLNGMSLIFDSVSYANLVVIYGLPKVYSEKLRELGGRWMPSIKAWSFTKESFN